MSFDNNNNNNNNKNFPSNSEANSNFKYTIPSGVYDFNNFAADPNLSNMMNQMIPNRIPNVQSMFDPKNVWGVNGVLVNMGKLVGGNWGK